MSNTEVMEFVEEELAKVAARLIGLRAMRESASAQEYVVGYPDSKLFMVYEVKDQVLCNPRAAGFESSTRLSKAVATKAAATTFNGNNQVAMAVPVALAIELSIECAVEFEGMLKNRQAELSLA